MAIGPLSAWFDPEPELVDFRNLALVLASKLQQKEWLPLHWAILSAAYPFWFNVAKTDWSLAESSRKGYTEADIQSA